MSRISNVANGIAPSMIRQLFNLAKTIDDVVDFTLGDPDVQPHENIKEAACRAIIDGKTRYSQNAGLLELREIISKRYKEKELLEYSPVSEIAITVGAMEGLYLTLLSLINPGDEVIIPAPYYVNYKQMVEMCGGTPVIVDPSDRKSLLVNGDDIAKAITDKTKIILLNSPANPSGRILSDDTVKTIAEVAIRNDLIVISDEVYRKLIYDDQSYLSIATLKGMKNNVVVINSLSKEFCMTGYRIGYVLGPEDIIAAIVKLQENVAACAPLPSQYAAIEALGAKEDYSAHMIQTFTKRRDTLYRELKEAVGIRVIKPEATFYAMVDISDLGYESSVQFAYDLLEKAHVAVVPGVAYGEICKDFIRIAFTLDESKIIEGARRIVKFTKEIVR